MSAYIIFQHEIDKHKEDLTGLNIVSKTSKSTLTVKENELRNMFIKIRGKDEDKVI